MAFSFLLFVVLYCQLFMYCEGYVITVMADCSNASSDESEVQPVNQSCMIIDEAIGALTSDSEVFLEQGTHVLSQPHSVHHLRNVSFTGASGVQIMCGDNIGLSFLNISGLTLTNLAIHGCGLTGVALQNTTSALDEILEVWFAIEPEIRVSLFLGHCEDLVMTNVTVNGTNGLGVLAINMMGDSIISDSNFTHNTRPSCLSGNPMYPFDVNPVVLNQTGGGAYFLYHDYIQETSFDPRNHSLLITNSYFAHNSDCSYSTLTLLNYRYVEDEMNRFTVGAGGGLSVLLAHSRYSISVRVESSTFYRNDARYGAGAFVGSFIDFVQPNHVTFDNCSFVENGLASVGHDEFSHSYCQSGGGLAIFTDLFKPSNLFKSILNVQNISIVAVDTTFIRNEAKVEGGGVFAHSLAHSPHRVYSLLQPDYFSIEWRLDNCAFYYNWARLNSAASFVQRIFHSIDGNIILHLKSLIICENGNEKDLAIIESNEISSTFAVNNVFTEFHGVSYFTDNYATALHVTSAFIHLMDDANLIFERNLGQRGGAIFMEGDSPGLYVSTNVSVVFKENLALAEGGAIYFGEPLYPTSYLQPLNYYGCLVGTLPYSNIGLFTSGSTFEFFGNTAPIGSVIFGESLELCPWVDAVSEDKMGFFSSLHNNFNSTFQFDEEPVGINQVSTMAASIRVSVQEELYPGEGVELEIRVFDHFGGEISAVVSSEVVEPPGVTSKLNGSRYWYTGSGMPTLQITGAEERAVKVVFFTFANMVRTTVDLWLLACPVGFEFHHGACECSPQIFLAQHSHHSFDSNSDSVVCKDLSVMISTESGYWIGVESYDDNTSSSSDLIVHECHLDYCDGNVTFRPPNFDLQCKNNSHRTGVLCGACLTSEGYSIVLGTNKCQICSNFYLFLIPLFAVLGVLLFLAIAFLEFTIDKGPLSALLFYCNIITIYSQSIFSADSAVHYLLIPVHFLNLEIGFGICFFDGMTAMSRAPIQFAFPLYLYLLMLILHLLAQRYSLSCYFSPAKTFVTLFVLSFVSLLNTCIEILAAHDIVTASGIRTVRWLIDPNVLYFRGWHGLLGVVALVTLFGYLLPFPLFLSLPSLAYKIKQSAKPLLDAFYAPYKDRYRFWIGVRLFIRVVMIVAVKFFPVSISLVINLVVLLVFVHVQTSIRPHKGRWTATIDSCLMINAAIIYVGYLVKNLSPHLFGGRDVMFFLGTSYLVAAAIFAYLIDLRFPSVKKGLTESTYRVWSLIRGKAQRKEVVQVPNEAIGPRPSITFLASLPPGEPMELQLAGSPQSEDRPALNIGHYRDSILDTLQ